MVNTRRKESGGSAHDRGLRYHTRKAAEFNERCTSGSNSECEESQEEDSWSSQSKPKSSFNKPQQALPSQVRELRNRFVCENRSHRDHHTRQRVLRSSRKHITLDKRHSLKIFSRNMHNSSLYNNNNSEEDEIFSAMSRRSRHLRRSRSHMASIERRTALSLRPISLKSYADPHSPSNYNDSDTDEKMDYVRRNTRRRTAKHENMSWLADDQMHKVGYPNIDAFSEEDSREAQDHLNSKEIHNSNVETKRITRHSLDLNALSRRRESKNPKYLRDYETRPKQKSRSEEKLKEEKQLRSRNESNDKENDLKVNINGRANGKIVKVKNEADKTNSDDSDNEKKIPNKNEKIDQDKKETVKKADGNEGENESEDSDNEDYGVDDDDDNDDDYSEGTRNQKRVLQTAEGGNKVQTRRSTHNQIIKTYPSRNTRNHKISESSSSSEAGKGYSLRDRPTKPPPKQIRAISVRELSKRRTRRHFTRSSSSSSSDSDDVCCKTEKYNKKNDQRMKSGPSCSKIIPITPETLDSNVRFSSIGGLDSHVQCLKEMILLPMMYPEVFRQFHIQPPRGVLFHGPPGTGKTLIARALANECSFGSRKISFFMRKGADLLSKWIGESEKQLRLLFEQAGEKKPSIIFFDELDGLAPVRSSRQDQVHASIVSTLLALMDGLDNRGEVIVIGATNRIDAIDPALRRPGRFDRELFFPLPSRKEREEILKVHVSQWNNPPDMQLISYLAEQAVGYCGSDLKALCTEAVIQGFRRRYPQVYTSEHRLLLEPETVKVEKIDFLRAKSHLIPASYRVHQALGRKLLPLLEPIFKKTFDDIIKILENTFPHGLHLSLAKVKLSACFKPAQLLLLGDGSEHGQTSHLAPAILNHMEHIHAYMLDLTSLYQETGRSPEEACIQTFSEARKNLPSIIYIPSIDNWWLLVSDTVKAIFVSQLTHMDPNIPILLLATADCNFDKLPDEIQNLFSSYRKEVVEIKPPDTESRRSFFKPLLIDACLRPPRALRKKSVTPPPLPRAPTPPPTPLTEEQAKKLYEQEEKTLRELRIFLRDMCKKLANNRLFYMFTKPVDTEEVPDYPTIIKQPMDLETMMTKVDFHRYECAKDFLSDIELICQNALEYNPAKTSADKQIRHRACSLRDYAYTLIKNEMDSDFEEKCQDISKKRRNRKASVSKYLPAYIQTINDNLQINIAVNHEINEQNTQNTLLKSDTNETSNNASVKNISPTRKRKTTSWQRGFVQNRKRKRREKKNDEVDERMSSADENNDTADIVVENSESKTCPSTPLTVNCGEEIKSAPLQSPSQRRQLSNLLSPSELLDDPLDFDDVDKALNEGEGASHKNPVNVHKDELEEILEQTVNITTDEPLQSLLDLHSQFRRVIKQFSRTHNRENLPKELLKELNRFKAEITDIT